MITLITHLNHSLVFYLFLSSFRERLQKKYFFCNRKSQMMKGEGRLRIKSFFVPKDSLEAKNDSDLPEHLCSDLSAKSDWRRTEITYRCNRSDRLVVVIEAERKCLRSNPIANWKLTGCGPSGQMKAEFITTFFCLRSDRITAPANLIAIMALNTFASDLAIISTSIFDWHEDRKLTDRFNTKMREWFADRESL